MSRALILGGTGAIGRATASRLLEAGWDVHVTGRDSRHVPVEIVDRGGSFITADREDPVALAAAMGTGADLLVDCLCYTASHATALLELARDATATVMISSKAVYADDSGNHTNATIAPHFAGPIVETQATVEARDVDYRTRDGYPACKVAAERVLLDSALPVTVIRPSKIHGVGAAPPREWVFVKRVLDRRSTAFFANRGVSVDHTTAAVNLAALIEVIAARPGSRILNCGDPTAPSTLEISRVIRECFGHVWREVLLEGDTELGHYLWEAPSPLVLDMNAARELGYTAVGTYEETVTAEVEWLLSLATRGDDGFELPGVDGPLVDYTAEDRFLARR